MDAKIIATGCLKRPNSALIRLYQVVQETKNPIWKFYELKQQCSPCATISLNVNVLADNPIAPD